jgi:hypothetical protein
MKGVEKSRMVNALQVLLYDLAQYGFNKTSTGFVETLV